MPLAVVCAVDWGHVDVLAHAATEGYLGICGSAAPWGPCWCPCSVLPLRPMWVSTVSAAPEAMLLSVATMMSEGWAVAKGCFDVRGLCCKLKPCLCMRFRHWWDNLPLSSCSSCRGPEFGSEHTGLVAIVCNSVYRVSVVFFGPSQLSTPCAQTHTHTVQPQTWDKRLSAYLTYQSRC